MSCLDLVSDVTRGCEASHVILVTHSDVVERQQSKAGGEAERARRTQSVRLSLTIWASLPLILLLAWLMLLKAWLAVLPRMAPALVSFPPSRGRVL